MQFWDMFLGTLFLLTCLLLIIVVLLQKGRGGGLGGAFGGAGSSAFGTRTGDVFTWVTIVLTALFLILAVVVILAFQQDAGRVASPRFDPPPGVIDGPVEVSMYTTTEGAAVHYTLDGSEPTRNSEVYQEEPVTIEPGTVIRARAFRAGWTPSEVVEAAWVAPAGEQGEDAAPPTEPTLEAVPAQ